MRRPPILASKYVLIRLLGRGAMGAVYEAVEAQTGVRLAIKVLRVIDKQNAGVLLARFEREAVAIRSVVSPHVPRILEAGRDVETGIEYIAMEFLRGEGLDKLLLRTDGVSTDLALRIVAQTCEGLAAAHEAGVIHRDIKPHNIFLAASGGEVVVKILDFGVAKLKMETFQLLADDITDTGSMLGSPRYMSPEQARGAKSIDHRADLWSLGVVMYELMAGVVPHAECRTIGNLMVAICSVPPKPLRERAKWVSRDYERVVDGALQINVANRYPTAAAMLADFHRLLPKGFKITPEMIVSADSLPTSVLNRVAQPEGASQDLPSLFETTGSGAAVRGSRPSVTSEELATQVRDWAKKHKVGTGPSSAVLDGEDDFPTDVMSFDEFPTAVLQANPYPGPQRVPRPSRNSAPLEEDVATERRIVERPSQRPAMGEPLPSVSAPVLSGPLKPITGPPSVRSVPPQEISQHSAPALQITSSPPVASPLAQAILDAQLPSSPEQPPAPRVEERMPTPSQAVIPTMKTAPVDPLTLRNWWWLAVLVLLAAAGLGAWVGWKMVVG